MTVSSISILMELHELSDMGGEPINTIYHDGESLIHFLAEITELKIDTIESPIDLPKFPVDLPKFSVNLPESHLRLSKSSSNKPFERREPPIDGSSCLGRFHFCHLSN